MDISKASSEIKVSLDEARLSPDSKEVVRSAIRKINQVRRRCSSDYVNYDTGLAIDYLSKSLKKKTFKAQTEWVEKAYDHLYHRIETTLKNWKENQTE